jgi:hypothetical protein
MCLGPSGSSIAVDGDDQRPLIADERVLLAAVADGDWASAPLIDAETSCDGVLH